MKRTSLVCAMAMAAPALQAQAAPSWQPQAGVVWTQPQGDLKQVSPENGWGVMLAMQAQETPQGAVRFFGEYRRFWTGTTRYSLADAGLLLTGTLTGPLYGFVGASAERIHLPGRDPAIKLGGRAGLGWALGRRASLEAGYTTASLDHHNVNTVEASLVFTF